MTKIKALPYRKKRVFIDLEYIDEKDLNKSIKDIFLLISQGNENHKSIRYHKTMELLSEFKQWYVNSNFDIRTQ